jgi:hypothetical protein
MTEQSPGMWVLTVLQDDNFPFFLTRNKEMN